MAHRTVAHVKEALRFNVKRNTRDEIEFEMEGADASIANALRRIMIAEVPTMAVDRVFIANNTSLIPDQVLSHRIGLIPIVANPAQFEFKSKGDEATSNNTAVFRMDVAADESEEVTSVYSGDFKWNPVGSQIQAHARAPIRPVHNDILIAKLKPGQSIRLEAHVTKGTGSMDTKWSPVCTATYTFQPKVELRGEALTEAESVALVEKCPMGVFDIEDAAAVVKDASACTLCQACTRDKPGKDAVKVSWEKEKFLFTVESTGCMSAALIVSHATRVFVAKCAKVQQNIG